MVYQFEYEPLFDPPSLFNFTIELQLVLYNKKLYMATDALCGLCGLPAHQLRNTHLVIGIE